MTISKVQLKDYLTKAGFTQTGTYDVVISITATPIDLSISTALAEEGSVKTAVIHVTRDWFCVNSNISSFFFCIFAWKVEEMP